MQICEMIWSSESILLYLIIAIFFLSLLLSIHVVYHHQLVNAVFKIIFVSLQCLTSLRLVNAVGCNILITRLSSYILILGFVPIGWLTGKASMKCLTQVNVV